MQIEVMNHIQAENYAMEAHEETTVIVSITDHCAFRAFIIPNSVNKVLDVLHVQFCDTDDTRIEYGGITDADAKNICNFINKYKNNDKITKIIIHCRAGQSRSAGVAAAIMKYLYNNDAPIFNNKKYTPNMLCYRKVLNTFMEEVRDE